MLKWTVTRRADEAGVVIDDENATTVGSINGRRSLGALNIKAAQTLDKGVQQNSQTAIKAHQRRSLGSTATVARRAINRDKENRCTSTPHPLRERDPASRFDPTSALRDVSNITPTSTPTRNSPMRRKRPLCESIIQMTPINQQPPPQYASTLPSFDIEYSPCGVRPTPFVALRGLGVADSYYEQPRYFVDEPAPPPKKLRPMPVECSPEAGLTPLSNRLSELRFSRISLKRRSRTRNINNNNNNNINEESLPSAAMGDVTLDRMIDAILESARKEKWKRKSFTLRGRDKCRSDNDAMKMCDPAQIASPTYTPAEDPASDLNEFRAGGELMLSTENFMDADRTIILEETTVLNEREVRTPDSVPSTTYAVQKPESPIDSCHLRRQKAVRRKHRNEIERIGLTIPNGIPSLSPCSAKKKICRVGLTLPHGIPSPETPINFYKLNSKLCQSFDDLAKMDTPKEIAIIVDSDQELKINTNNHPAIQQTDSNFSKKSNDEVSPGIAAIDRQPSSTPTSAPTGDSSETPRVTSTTANILGRRCLTFSPDLGSSEDSLEKRRSVASSVASRYSRCATVKGSLDLAIFAEGNILNVHVIRCRDLQRPNNKPINAYVKVALSSNEANDNNNNNNNSGGGGFQRTAVHRNSSRPYFDHRFTFDLNERNFDINQKHRIQLAVWHRDREYKRSEFLGCMSFLVKNVLKKEVNGSFRLQPQTCLTNPQPPIVMGENSQSSCDEVNSLEGEGDNAIGSLLGNDGADSNIDGDNGGSTIPLSKTALHQRDADENLFLRFLELDPPIEDSPPNAERRASSCRAPCGRTPFTITKRLIRTADKGFGFSIVWTHPPRIEKVEPSLSAASAGILPGDYVIFVDKTNIVTTPEVDILNLIKAQENVLLLEIFRRSARPPNGLRSTGRGASFNSSQQGCGGDEIHGHTISGSVPGSISCASATATATATVAAAAATIFQQQQSLPFQLQQPLIPISAQQQIVVARSATPLGAGARSSTACSNASISAETSKRRLHLPQVTFSKESVVTSSAEDQRRRFLYQLISREQHFVTALQFGMERFTTPLRERKDLISQNDHRTLFQNIDELMQISEDILEQLQLQDDGGGGGGVSIGVCNGNVDSQMHFVSRVYLSKTTAICAAYKKYCNGLKRADCVLVNKSRYQNSDFVKFINEPQVPRKRPDMTTFIHRPLQHYREILKLVQLMSSHSRADTEENKNLLNVINEFQAAYREITVGGGLMEPLGEGRPLLTLQDLESRLVFTRCKPFILAAPGRQWIFGGDLSRVEGRSVKPYWTLLFSDILLFAKVSRDRVLFITEEPLQLGNITDSCFNIRKKPTEFRLTVDPNGRTTESPTTHCAPDLTKTPRRNARRRSIILRAPSPELKAVWQNLLQRQIFIVNAALGLTPLSSPLESPDILQTMLPLSDIGAATTSMASIKLSSNDSLPLRQHNLHFTQNLNQMQQTNQQQQQQQQHHQQQLHNNPVTHHLHQLQQQHQSQRPSDVIARKLEELIDEKCRLLNKTGTSKGGALHLAQWMKGQLDERQREAMADLRYSQHENHIDSVPPEYSRAADVANANVPDDHIEEWSREQLQQRSRELQLIDASGGAQAPPKIDAAVRLCESRLEEITLTDEESKSASRSTTSDSQITVRSSPIANATDKISVCRQCHKNCRSKMNVNGQNIPATGPVSSSLKVQHSQSSPNRCCSTAAGSIGGNSKRSPTNSTNSTATTTVTAVPSPVTKATPLVNGGTDVIGILSRTPNKCTTPCPCKCTPSDFVGTTLSPDELHHETCRLIPSVHDVNRTPTNSNNKTHKPVSQTTTTTPTCTSNATTTRQNHKNCKCVCMKRDKDQVGTETRKTTVNNNTINNLAKKVTTVEEEEDDDWSRLLIGLAQINPTTSLVHMDPFEAVPTISIVPPTPEGKISRFGNPLMWDSTRLSLEDLNRKNDGQTTMNGGDNSLENSPDSPPGEEPPYRALNTSLRRYGTMSSLEKLPSEDTDDKSYNSSDEEDNDDVDECLDDDQSDIKIVTKEIYSNTQALRNWTARAGSFFEESRAFIDRYLGRTTSSEDQADKEEENAEECTSGATSGEEVWGTPTSGGENDEMQMFNSDHAHSSPTKSTSSLTGDDDTELMMDELLMAPPMTASTVRGLLPRRRLEPLFEEDTESADTDDDEKTPLDGGGGCYTTILGDGGLFNNLHKKQGQYMERVSIYGRVSRSSSESSSSDSAVEAEQHRRLQLQKHQDTMSRPKTNSPTTMTTTSMMMMAPIMPLPQQAAKQIADVPITVMNTSSMAMTMKWVMRDGQATDIVNPSDTFYPSVMGGGGNVGNNIGKDEDDVTIVGYNVNYVERERINGIGIGHSREPHENESVTGTEHSVAASSAASGAGLSPRLEMRLALNQDILGDEDLMNYDPGPNLTSILGRDLSRYHRMTGREILNRSTNRVAAKEVTNSFYQQKNSKMDTPTPNRRRSNQSTWNNFASVDLAGNTNLPDLEKLARQEKQLCQKQMRNGHHPDRVMGWTKNITAHDKYSHSSGGGSGHSINTQGSGTSSTSKTSKIINFLTRRNSENQIIRLFSRDIGDSSTISLNEQLSSTAQHTTASIKNVNNKKYLTTTTTTKLSSLTTTSTHSASTVNYSSSSSSSTPQRSKDYDKQLDRRFWKQLSKRRRSLSEITAS